MADGSTKPLMRRAYAGFTVKKVNEDERIIEGIATTPTPDRYGDVVEPKGAVFNLPMPLLWQHMSTMPVGHVTKAKATNEGIEVVTQIAKIDEPGILKDRLDEAWQSVKHGLVRAFSIGFIPLEQAQIKDTWSYHFLEWEWLELSLVTIPANAEATISTIKSIDRELRAASGQQRSRVVRLNASELRRARRATSGAVFLR